MLILSLHIHRPSLPLPPKAIISSALRMDCSARQMRYRRYFKPIIKYTYMVRKKRKLCLFTIYIIIEWNLFWSKKQKHFYTILNNTNNSVLGIRYIYFPVGGGGLFLDIFCGHFVQVFKTKILVFGLIEDLGNFYHSSFSFFFPKVEKFNVSSLMQKAREPGNQRPESISQRPESISQRP